MLLPVESGRAGLHFGLCESYEYCYLNRCRYKEHYEKVLSSSIKQPFYATETCFFKVSGLDSTIKLNIKHQTRIKISIRT